MTEQNAIYIWRCAKCSCHFANLLRSEGMTKLEKKCPKCKALNVLSFSEKEITLHCRVINEYGDRLAENGFEQSNNI